MIWRMRRISAKEFHQLFHLDIGQNCNGYYKTACGLRFGKAGSTYIDRVTGNSCLKCMKYLDKHPELEK